MNYMAAPDAQPTQPDCPPIRGQYLNFDAKRVGRAVADLHLGSVSNVTILPYKAYTVALSTTCDFAFGDLPACLYTWWDWDAHDLALLHDAEAESLAIGSEPIEEEDADAELVQWFTEQQSVAEQAIGFATSSIPSSAAEPQDEVILASHSGLRSGSWRGGGTMRRR